MKTKRAVSQYRTRISILERCAVDKRMDRYTSIFYLLNPDNSCQTFFLDSGIFYTPYRPSYLLPVDVETMQFLPLLDIGEINFIQIAGVHENIIVLRFIEINGLDHVNVCLKIAHLPKEFLKAVAKLKTMGSEDNATRNTKNNRSRKELRDENKLLKEQLEEVTRKYRKLLMMAGREQM
ncbi:hypothetical protein PRIPAC_88481 [Pristionchus pacificus]|uniref:Uncharacterized protein n=1 Tax=Pristionchus pacificus TaxID=54126 RepID=A0A2A6CV47_PRIPA|nr:hypothetical protein PRIPAC_88481 [Pristionchus pacificus]|eukprot:PDM82055.1 hypothetical protein PRIPAC_36448 [Pristionchus pacificus]